MRNGLRRASLNQKLGLLALGLGALAVLADVAPARSVTVHAKELLTSVERREDHVTAADLAAWIVAGRADYRLIDLRDERAFAEYHVPGAESLPLAKLMDGSLARNEKLVLYGDGGIHAAQAWMLLRGAGYRASYTLLGGLDAWREEVLFPAVPASPSPEQGRDFERRAQLARFFGGQPRATSVEGAVAAMPLPAAAPAVAAPTLPAGAGATPARKKKEGC